MDRALRIEVRHDSGVFDELHDWWNSLSGPRTSPFLTAEWFGTWARTRLGDNEQPYVPVVYDGQDPVAAIALVKNGLRFRSMADGSTDAFDMVRVDGDAGVDALLGHLTKLTRITFDRLDGASPLLGPTETSERWSVQRHIKTPFVDLSRGLEPVWERLGSKKRTSIRRAHKALEEIGDIDALTSIQPPELTAVLNEAFELESRGWKGSANVAVSSDSGKLRFYTEFAHIAHRLGWLHISRLMVGSQLAAWEYNLEYQGHMYGVLKSYDETLPSRTSPGTVLFTKSMEAAVDRGDISFALGGDDSTPWKTAWTAESRERADVSGFGSSPTGRTARVASSARQVITGLRPGKSGSRVQPAGAASSDT